MTWSYVFYTFVLVPGVAIAFVIGGVWVIGRLAKRGKSTLAKISIAIAVLILLTAIPTADELLGRYRFSRLCETDAGAKVFRTVVLEPGQMNSDGSPKTQLIVGTATSKIGDRYRMEFSDAEVFASPRITRIQVEIRDGDRGEVLGRRINYHYWGGWLVQLLPGHRSAKRCSGSDPTLSLDKMVFRSSVAK